MRRLKQDRLCDLFSAIAKEQTLYLPKDTAGGARFLPWEEGDVLSSAVNTVRSAKDFFFPQTENLMDFRVSGKKIEIVDLRSETEDFVLFGVRACDARSFAILDQVFLSDPADTYYQNRRAHATIVSLSCNRPAETCFCRTFGIDAADPEGDVVCHTDGTYFYLDAKTEKGNALLCRLESVTEACSSDGAEAVQEEIRNRVKNLPLATLSVEKFVGEDPTMAFFNDPAWSSLSRSCLGCGTCTFVCPTCQCYDVRDFKTNDGVKRFRCWDSCMYSEFTKMSAGQPRLTQTERFRQRFMHKLVYYPINHDGVFGCVGCGRCIASCPIRMNIVKVMKKLGNGGEHNV